MSSSSLNNVLLRDVQQLIIVKRLQGQKMGLKITFYTRTPVMQQSPINFHFLCPSPLCHLLMGSLATQEPAGYTDICIMVDGKFLPP